MVIDHASGAVRDTSCRESYWVPVCCGHDKQSHDARPAAAAGIPCAFERTVVIAARGMDAAEEQIALRPGVGLGP